MASVKDLLDELERTNCAFCGQPEKFHSPAIPGLCFEFEPKPDYPDPKRYTEWTLQRIARKLEGEVSPNVGFARLRQRMLDAVVGESIIAPIIDGKP